MQLSLRKLLFSFLAISIITTLYFLNEDTNKQDTTNIPLILADKEATKVRPIEPGGVEFPNMDKSVYEYISPSKNPLRNEKVMPEPEQPILAVRSITPESAIESVFNTEPTIIEDIQNESIFLDNPSNGEDSFTLDELNIITTDQSDSRLLNNSETRGRKTSEKYKLQICASKTEKFAIAGWNKALKNNKDLIGKYNYTINKVDLGEKGLIYKLNIGPFNSYNEANSLCKKLIKRKQSCLVVNE